MYDTLKEKIFNGFLKTITQIKVSSFGKICFLGNHKNYLKSYVLNIAILAFLQLDLVVQLVDLIPISMFSLYVKRLIMTTQLLRHLADSFVF